jgi:phage terminase Nu1 subunit (DNA packaging protein)
MSLEHSPARSTDHAASVVFVDENRVAEILDVSVRSVQRMRETGCGPTYRKFGRLVRYALADVLAWADAQTRGSTSEAA